MTKCLTHVRDINFCLYVQILTKCLRRSYISQFLICLHAKIWFLFVCFNSNEMFWQFFMFCFRLLIVLHVKVYMNLNETFATTLYFAILIFVTFFDFCEHVQILSKCLQRLVSRNLRSCLHVRIVLDIQWIISLVCFIWSTYILKCFHQNVRSEIVCMNDVFFMISVRFTIFSYWFQNVFIEILDQKLFVLSTFFLLKLDDT